MIVGKEIVHYCTADRPLWVVSDRQERDMEKGGIGEMDLHGGFVGVLECVGLGLGFTWSGDRRQGTLACYRVADSFARGSVAVSGSRK